MKLFNFFTRELAIDLGTANTLIIQDGQIIIDEPSIVAINRKTGETIAVGTKAMQMHEKTHENIKTVRPLKDGVIADFQAAENLIEGLINMTGARKKFFSHMKMVICIPSGITEVEKRAVFDSADHVDSKETYLIHEPMAAARQHNILIGERTAEQIKIHAGSALQELDKPPADFAVNGRDLLTGIPKQITITYQEIAHCLDKSISKVEDAILKALETTPPELASDIYKTGLYLTGGGALLRGLDKRISLKTKLPVHVAEDPLRAVVRGTGIALKNTDKFSFLIDRRSV